MTLTLEVLPPQSGTLGDGGRRTFSAKGGTLGRAGSCDWVLSHRKVSGRHATISYQDGIFYIVDEQSANGVFINSTTNRLVPGRRYALKNGDRIIIDPYEMEVSISTGRGHEARRPADDLHEARGLSQSGRYNPFESADPFALPPRTPAPIGASAPTPRPSPAGEVTPLEELDPLKLLEGKPKSPPARQAPNARDLDRASPLANHYQPPAVLTPQPTPPQTPPPNSSVIPADYDPLKDDFDEPFEIPTPPIRRAVPQAPPAQSTEPPATPVPADPRPLTPPDASMHRPAAATPAPRPIATPTPRAVVSTPDVVHVAGEPVGGTPSPVPADERPDSGLLAVLGGAGLHHAPVTLEFARNFGQIFRVVVSGVMDVLRARQQIKDEFRMQTDAVQARRQQPAQVLGQRGRCAAQPAREAQRGLSRAGGGVRRCLR